MLVQSLTYIIQCLILLALLPLLMIKNSVFVVIVVRVGKISISVSIKNGKYRGNIYHRVMCYCIISIFVDNSVSDNIEYKFDISIKCDTKT